MAPERHCVLFVIALVDLAVGPDGALNFNKNKAMAVPQRLGQK